MRRLPIFFVIDVSESMVGGPIRKVEDGIRRIITELKRDPSALETVFISIIVFAGKAKTLIPLTDIVSFYPPKFPIGSGTSFGNALKHLIKEVNRNIIHTTYESKGDWKPIIFFMTDGNPTDNYIIDLGIWEQNWKSKVNIVAISIGDQTNLDVLSRISNDIIMLENEEDDSFKEFFKWTTDTIKVQSQKIEERQNED